MNLSNHFLKVLGVSLAFCIFFSSCGTPKDLEFREFKNLSVENIGFSGANLKVDVVYYNPNNFSLELNRTDLDIYVDSTFLGHSSQELQVKIPKREAFSIPLKVELEMKNLLKNGLMSLLNKQVMVKVTGKVRVGKGGVYKTFDMNYQTLQQFSF
ncbi:MAG: LEA type 2 family protein [Ferruginibacter sp.]